MAGALLTSTRGVTKVGVGTDGANGTFGKVSATVSKASTEVRALGKEGLVVWFPRDTPPIFGQRLEGRQLLLFEVCSNAAVGAGRTLLAGVIHNVQTIVVKVLHILAVCDCRVRWLLTRGALVIRDKALQLAWLAR